MNLMLFGYFGAVSGFSADGNAAISSSLSQLYRRPGSALFASSTIGQLASSSDGQLIGLIIGAPRWEGTRNSQAASQLLDRYRVDGPSVFRYLHNAFIAVILDHTQNSAHLAIDRIGRMPLSYASVPDGGICFSSDSILVANIIESSPSLNVQAIYDYSFFHAVPSPETIFKRVQKLEPATQLEWRDGKVRREIYWRPTFAHKNDKSIDALSTEFLESLEQGVKAADLTDRTASFLSGGIDSSTVTGLVAKLQGRGRPAYTIGFEQTGYDETEYARIAAEKFGADLRVHYITTKEVETCIPELASIYDEPFGNSSAVPALVCSRLAKADGIDHMLAGDGGDELFAGNARYAKQRIFEAYGHVPSFGRMLAEKLFLSPLIGKTPLRKIGSYIKQAKIPLPDRLESYNFLLRENIVTMFEPEFLRLIDAQRPFELLRTQYFQAEDATTLDRMLYLDWKFTLADNDLRKVNTTCAHAGVKVSYPWLDDRVIDFSTTLPPTLKMRGTKLRYFAKHALTGFLPNETITKSKHGFGLPFGQWLKTSADLQKQVYDLLDALARRGVFRAQFIHHLIDEHRGGHAAYYGTMVWVLAMLEAWLQANKSVRL